MTRPAHLHLLCGKAGSGKSTLAKDLASRHRALLICEDVWMARLFGDRLATFDDYLALSRRLASVVGPLVTDLLSLGQDVVLDFPANTQRSRAWLRSLAEGVGAGHVLHHVDVPDAVCLQRIGRRNVERPEGSHHLSEDDFAHVTSFFEAPTADEGFTVVVHAPGEASGSPSSGGDRPR